MMNEHSTGKDDKNQSGKRDGIYQEIDFTKENLNLLTCPKCNHIISASEIDVEHTKATCSHCGHQFGFVYDSTHSNIVPELLIPAGIEELKLRSELDLRLHWKETTSKRGRWFMLFFASVWNLVVLPFALGAIFSGEWGILLFLTLHLIIGLGLIWHLATLYTNSTSISVTKERIRISTFPLKHPIWRSKEIQTDSIDQLYVSRYVESTSNGVENYAYALYAITKSGEKVSLIRGMTRETQEYIEKAVEDYLEIKNRKVKEEAF